jgi:ketosteroid isomerase-like protein
MAWRAYFAQDADDALRLMRRAADAEDASEKLPVTPGPIVPAREQLGVMLLDLNRPQEARTELESALKEAPGRLAALKALQRATGGSGDADNIKAERIAQNDAIVRHDLDAIASYWTDDVTIQRGLGAQESGKQAYLKLFRDDDPNSKDLIIYVRTPDAVEVSHEWPLAFETGLWQGHQGGVSGPVVIEGRYSAQWVKRQDRWLIRSEVFVALNGFGAGKDFKAIP